MEESGDVDNLDLVPCNPIEEKDKQIAALQKTVEMMGSQAKDISDLKQALSKSESELKAVKSEQITSQRKLEFTKNVTEKKLLDSISNPGVFNADPIDIGVYSATLNEEEFEFNDDEEDTTGEGSRSRKDVFLKSIEEKLDPENKEHKERFKDLKNLILEKVKVQQLSRARSRSCSMSSRSSSQKRGLSTDSLPRDNGKSPPTSRPRTMLPVKQQ